MKLRLPPPRLILLFAVAALMAFFVALDRGVIGGGEREPSTRRRAPLPESASPSAAPTVTDKAPQFANTPAEPAVIGADASVAPVSRPLTWQQLAARHAELKGYIDGRESIEQAYAAVGAPYAEAIATYGATYPAGNKAGQNLDKVIREHISGRLRLVELKVIPAAQNMPGGIAATARISLLAADSLAMNQTLLDLGNPDNGLLWKELTVLVDPAKKTLRADGVLALTLVELAE